jgi:hypothetical protein
MTAARLHSIEYQDWINWKGFGTAVSAMNNSNYIGNLGD